MSETCLILFPKYNGNPDLSLAAKLQTCLNSLVKGDRNIAIKGVAGSSIPECLKDLDNLNELKYVSHVISIKLPVPNQQLEKYFSKYDNIVETRYMK